MGYLQSTGYVRREDKKGRFSPERYDAKLSTFGLIVFENDLDIDAAKVYAGYDDRWKTHNTSYDKLLIRCRNCGRASPTTARSTCTATRR